MPPLHGDPLAISFLPSSIADSAPLSIPYVPSSIACVPSTVGDSTPLSARRRRSLARSLARSPYIPSPIADSAPLPNFPYVPSSIADSAHLSIPYVQSSVAYSALLSGSDPELPSSSSGGSDANRAQAVLTDSDTIASPIYISFLPSSIADSAPLSIPYVPSSIADAAPLSNLPCVPSTVGDSTPLSARRWRSLARPLARSPYIPSPIADSAPLSNFPYVPSSIADSAPLSIPYVPSSVADSALLSGSDPELPSSSSGGSDANRAQAVLTDSDTIASPRSVVLSWQKMRVREWPFAHLQRI